MHPTVRGGTHMDLTNIRTIFTSDLHLGNKWCKHEEFLTLLKTAKHPEYLYLLGDFIDGWALKQRRRTWHEAYNKILRKILKMDKHGTQIIYTYGNHDDFLHSFIDVYGHITLTREHIHTTTTGKKYLCLHGDEFDCITKYAPFIAFLGNIGYAFLLNTNWIINKIRKKTNKQKHWSFSHYMKHHIKQAVAYLNDFENLVTLYAAHKDCHGVICGHIHTPTTKTLNGITYINTGDFQENATAVIERTNGQLELIDLLHNTTTPIP
jgi:UDP-2,3-diacylglucosamine pyrophosphatase LpxH